MNIFKSLVIIFSLMFVQLIFAQGKDTKVICYNQYCEQNEETLEWECETKEPVPKDCGVNNICMESQLPPNEFNIQQGCKFEGFMDEEDDAKITKGEMVCDDGYCYCKTDLCNNKNFKMPEKYTVKEPKATRRRR